METYQTIHPVQLALKYGLVGFFVGAVTIGITFAIMHSAYADPNALSVAETTNSQVWQKLDSIKGHCEAIVNATEEAKKMAEEANQLIREQSPKG